MKLKLLQLLLLVGALGGAASAQSAADVQDAPGVATYFPPTAQAAGNARPLASFAVPVVSLSAPPPAAPRNVASGVGDILKARFPLSIGFEDLGAGWRVFDFGDLYFSRGETTFVSGQEYVVAYKRVHSDVSKLSPREYIVFLTRSLSRTGSGDRYRLTLMPVSNVQTILGYPNGSLRSFDPKEFLLPASVSTSDAFEQNLSLVFLRKLNEAVRTYSGANLNVLPPLGSAFQARQNLDEFAENAAIFTQPGTNQPFAWNPIFSGRKRAHLSGKSGWILAYEAAAHPDGSRAVLTLGGRVFRLSDKQWRKLATVSGLTQG